MATADERIMAGFRSWFKGLKPRKQYAGRPAKGTIAAALVVLERLRQNPSWVLEDHLAPGGAQIAGLALPALRKILGRYGETREFPSEGGRTNRGNNRPVAQLLEALNKSGFDKLTTANRSQLLDTMQRYLVDSLKAYYELERIRFDFDVARPLRVIIGDILAKADTRDQGGPVAQHLVGAKLAIRFPRLPIDNFPTVRRINRPADKATTLWATPRFM